jgi:hypothetical protein
MSHLGSNGRPARGANTFKELHMTAYLKTQEILVALGLAFATHYVLLNATLS